MATHGPRVDVCDRHRVPAPVWGMQGDLVPGASARCRSCFAPLPPGIAASVPCRACRVRPPGFVGAVAPFDYRGGATGRPENAAAGVGEWILRFKHGGRRDLAAPLARMMAWALGEPGVEKLCPVRPSPGDLFVPVPLHPSRRMERGYDQAARLAVALASLLEGDVLTILRRRRATAPQGDLAAPPRRRNVHGAFRLACPLPTRDLAASGTKLWLVDDVMTSGATASACAYALRQGGAPEVRVLALARA